MTLPDGQLNSRPCPRLLVSVRDAAEAVSAISGGCDLLDIKEPNQGSLGMADRSVIFDIIATANNAASRLPVSAALGEIIDWQRQKTVPLPGNLSFVKLGTAGLATDPAWHGRCNEIRHRFERSSETPLSWIAVAYADWKIAQAPAPAEVVEAALRDRSAGILFDTFSKTGRGLFDSISTAELKPLILQAQARGLMVAVAGSLKTEDLLAVTALRPDIIAIRSAACREEKRNSQVDPHLVRQFKNVLRKQHDHQSHRSQDPSISDGHGNLIDDATDQGPNSIATPLTHHAPTDHPV